MDAIPRFAILIGLTMLNAMAVGCAAQPAASVSPQQSLSSILVSSSPAAGSMVRNPVDNLQLHFNPPARLDDVIVAGPDGVMPMMVHSVGEVADYSLPLSDLRPGSYTVKWQATTRGREYSGSFEFSVR